MTNKNVPKLRFKENSHLRETTLGGICKFFKGKGISKNDLSEKGTPCIRYGELYTTYNEIVTEIKERTNLNKNDLVLSSKNDVLLPCSGETAIDLGNATCVLKDGVALGGDITIIKTKENGVFLSYYLNYKRTKLAKYAQGISIMHLYPKYFKKMTLSIPPIDEQEKIASFLYNIDKKIGLLKGKKDEYVKFKQYLLQNLFPQNDEKTPKLRFIKYNDEWKTCKLNEVVEIPEKNKITSITNKKLLTVKLHTNGIEINENTVPKLTKKGRPYYIRHTNEILIGRQNFHNGGIGILPEELDGGICSNAITSFNVIKDIALTKYVYYYLSRTDYYKRSEKYIGGTGQKEYSEKTLLSLNISFPSTKEQEKIASFLSFVDKKIDLLNQEIEQLEEYKKGLLQKMFI